MKQPLFTKNVPIDEKRISHIERIVARLTRRARSVTKAIITPYPISYCATGDDIVGDILKYLFCSRGQVVKGMVILGSKPKEGVAIVISITNDLGKTEKSYNITRKSIIVEPNFTIFSGDKLTVSIYPINPEVDKITEVWLSFLWIPHVKDAEVKNFLIDEIENDLLERGDE